MYKRLTYILPLALTGALLSSCSTPSNPNPGPGPGPQPEPPAGVSALVIEDVESPVYDELAKSVEIVPYDGSQKAEDHDLVIFDGDAQTPEAVQNHELVRAALRAHKWVLAVDVTAEHKEIGLGGYLLASTKGASPGYLTRITEEPNGHTGTQIVEFPNTPQVSGDIEVVPTEGTAEFVRSALEHLGSGVTQTETLQADPGPDIPAYVNYYPFYFQQTVPWTAKGAKKANKSGTQSVYYQLNTAFDVFLDTATNPLGDFQWVSARLDGQANPTNGTNKFVNIAHDEKAWFQDQFPMSVTPTGTYNSQFSSVGSSPETANNTTTVTSGVNFTVGLNKDGPSASFGYSYSQERNLTDWKITNDSAGNLMSWNYRSNNPYDADKATYQCGDVSQYNNGFNSDCFPETPADLSLNTLSTHAQGVWNTQQSGVITGSVDFDVHSEQHLADPYCSSDFGPTCGAASDTGASRGYVYDDNTYTINMSAVIPIAIESITFSENPANAGDTVTGTITLASAAQRDTQIQLSSNSENATVLPDVTIPQGQTSATFQVLTNANGISSGGNTVATITALYGSNSQAQLTINNP